MPLVPPDPEYPLPQAKSYQHRQYPMCRGRQRRSRYRHHPTTAACRWPARRLASRPRKQRAILKRESHTPNELSLQLTSNLLFLTGNLGFSVFMGKVPKNMRAAYVPGIYPIGVFIRAQRSGKVDNFLPERRGIFAYFRERQTRQKNYISRVFPVAAPGGPIGKSRLNRRPALIAILPTAVAASAT
jgi:hypothetical protein